MKITDRLLKVQLAVLDNKVNGDGELGKLVGEAAEAAMINGMDSEEWKNYMSLFADSADQFKRLTTTELDGTDKYLQRIRAYIVANGICAPGTEARTGNNLMNIKESNIDKDKPNGDPLNEVVDATVKARRPFPVD